MATKKLAAAVKGNAEAPASAAQKPQARGVSGAQFEAPQPRPAGQTTPDQVAQIAALMGGGEAESDDSGAPGARSEGLKPDSDDLGPDSEDLRAPVPGEPDDDTPAEGSPGEPGGAGERVTVRDLADTLGVKAAELWEGLEVPVGKDAEGKPIYANLAQVRDSFTEAQTMKAERQAWDEEKTATELRHMQLRGELDQVLELVGPLVTPEVQRVLQNQTARALERERRLLLEAIPAWKDPARFASDRDMIADFFRDTYGVPRVRIESLSDHVTIRIAYDMARFAQQRKALEEARLKGKKPGSARAPSAPVAREGGQAPLGKRLGDIVRQGRNSQTREGKAAAIGALLRATGGVQKG